MELTHITLNSLTPARANVRKVGAKDIADLTASIGAIGLLQPLLVRPKEDGFEIVAGQRRYHALCALYASGATDVPCIIMEESDDAAAIEASLAENLIRLPMDEIDQYKAFAALVKQGLTAAEIAARFAVTEKLVTQRLAIAHLLPQVLTLYRKEEIGADTLRSLTMATKAQQKEWFALFQENPRSAPQGYRLTTWLFGGQRITTEAALFDLERYDGNIIRDLFGEDSYFDDPNRFWICQNTAIAALKTALEGEGWTEVTLLEIGARFPSWDYVDTAQEDGGKVYIQVAQNGEVTAFKGQLSRKELRQRKKGDAAPTPKPTPELSKPMQNYLALHRHAAVRSELASEPSLALCVAVAQIIAGSRLWAVQADPQRAGSEAIRDSLANNKAEAAFATTRKAAVEALGMDAESETIVPRKEDWQVKHDFGAILATLCALSDAQVMQVLAVVTAETLAVGSEAVEILGAKLGTDMHAHWSPDQAFFDLMRNKPALNAMVAELAGQTTAAEHITATAKTQQAILQACLDGSRTAQAQDWQPRYMDFPMGSYVQPVEDEDVQEEAA